MITRVAAFGLLCLFSACSVPYGAPEATPTRTTETQQNYAPDAMFMQEHGEFMLKREPWRPDAMGTIFGMADSEVKGENGDFNLRYIKADIERRIHLADPNIYVDVGLQFGHRQYDFSKAAPNGTPSGADLFRGTATIEYGQFFSKDVLMEVQFMPGVWSDFSGTITHEDWEFFGRGVLTWRVDPTIFIVGGAEHSNMFRHYEVYPLLGAAWVPTEDWRVDVLLPRQARVTWTPEAHTSAFFSVDLVGEEYAARTSSPGKRRTRFSVQEFQVSVGGLHRFNANLSGHLRVGTTIGGHYEFRDNGPQVYDGTLEPQAFAEVGFGWTF